METATLSQLSKILPDESKKAFDSNNDVLRDIPGVSYKDGNRVGSDGSVLDNIDIQMMHSGYKPGEFDNTDVKDRSALKKMLDENIVEKFEGMLKIFLAQIENQLPDDDHVADAAEIGKSMVVMLGAAEQAQTNDLLKKNQNLLRIQIATSSNSMLGREVHRASNEFNFDGTPQEMFYDMPNNVANATMTIHDISGQSFHKIKLNTDPGTHKTAWSGHLESDNGDPVLDENDNPILASKGRYTTSVQLFDKQGQVVLDMFRRDKDGNQLPKTVDLRMVGEITSYGLPDDGPPLYFDSDIPIEFSDILHVRKKHKLAELTSPPNQVNDVSDGLRQTLITDYLEPHNDLK